STLGDSAWLFCGYARGCLGCDSTTHAAASECFRRCQGRRRSWLALTAYPLQMRESFFHVGSCARRLPLLCVLRSPFDFACSICLWSATKENTPTPDS